MLKQFLSAGGQLKRQTVKNFEDLANDNYDLIVNCAGLNGGHIAKDSKITAIRGQVMRVNASWQFHVYLDDGSTGYYVIPKYEFFFFCLFEFYFCIQNLQIMRYVNVKTLRTTAPIGPNYDRYFRKTRRRLSHI